jgi:hypothetical protein
VYAKNPFPELEEGVLRWPEIGRLNQRAGFWSKWKKG